MSAITGFIYDHQALVAQLIIILTVFVMLQISAAVMVYFERKISAWAQQRQGPTLVGPYGLLQPLAEKSAAYSRHVYEIASGTGAELGKAIEAQAAEAQKKFLSVVDNAAKNAPAGSETAVAVFKSAVAASTNAIESVQKAVKQATDVAEANFNAVASTAVNASKTATAASKKR